MAPDVNWRAVNALWNKMKDISFTAVDGIKYLNVIIKDNQLSPLGDGNKVVAVTGTQIQLSSVSVPCKLVYVEALRGNTGLVSHGVNTTTPSGTVRGGTLGAGDPVYIPCTDLNQVYINGTAGDGVSFSYYG